MLRCATSVVCVAIGPLALPASAQLPRQFSSTALRGELIASQAPDVLINRRPARLAPGVRVRVEDNRQFDPTTQSWSRP